jgi:transmembrane sensor
MAFDEQRLRYLLKLFTNNQATKEQIREMLILLRSEGGNNGLQSVEWERIWDNVHQSAVLTQAPVRKIKWLHVAAAAIIVLFLGAGAYLFNRNTTSDAKNNIAKVEPVKHETHDVLPGGNKAVLTLANGQQIILDNAANGVLAHQGNSDVVKLANGELAYRGRGSGEKAEEVIYNTLGTPRGGQYRLMLPDGSKVWLNAVSSIRYPTAFTGKERTVEITGEAYFEVVKDKSKPFKVTCHTDAEQREAEGSAEDEITITVLGTHFNVNAYSDEPTAKTTLLEGSVKVTRNNHSVIINPGEQTQLSKNGTLKVIHDANVDEAVAWRNGLFEFQDADLQSILRQVMRWYDVEVEYQGNIPDRYFTAIISREKTLTGVLEILKLSDIDYKLEGKKLVVTQ